MPALRQMRQDLLVFNDVGAIFAEYFLKNTFLSNQLQQIRSRNLVPDETKAASNPVFMGYLDPEVK